MTNLLNKKISAPIKASFWLLVSSFLLQGISILTTPIFTRILTTYDYGVTSLYNSWSSMLSIMVTLNLSYEIYNNAILDFKDEINSFTSSMFGLSTINASFFYIIYLLFHSQIQGMMHLSTTLINIMFFSFMLIPAINFWMASNRFKYNYRPCIILSLIISILTPVGSIVAIVISPRNEASAKIIGGLMATLIVGAFLYIRFMVKGKSFINLKYWKYALSFNLPLLPHYFAQIALSQLDRIMISNMVGVSEAGIYTIGYSAASVISILWNAINASWVPWTYKKMKEEKYTDIGDFSKPILSFCAVACIGFIAFTPEIIKILAPPTYCSAIYVVPPVVVGMFFSFVSDQFSNIIFYNKKTIFVMISSISAAGLNVVLNLLLIPAFGFIVAAYTTMLGYLALCLLNYIIMKKIDKNVIYDIKSIIILMILLVSISILLLSLYNLVIIRYSIIIGIGVGAYIFRKRIIGIFKVIQA